MNANKRFGVIATYVHAGAQLRALVEVCCESRAASMSHEVGELAHDVAMHVAAATNNLRLDGLRAGRGEPFVQRVAHLGMERLHERACLLEQKFVKDPYISIHHLLDARGALLKEKLRVVRIARFSINDLGVEEGQA